jgi:hypothetical protein
MAQLALTAKRVGVLEGHPLAATSPAEYKNYTLSDDRCWIAVDAVGVTVAAKVRPMSVVPADVKLVRPAEAGRFEDRILEMMQDPKPPMVALRFAKKASMKMVVNHGGAVFSTSDRSGLVTYDVQRVGELLALVQRFGRKSVDEAAKVRALVAKGDPGAPKALADLRQRFPDVVSSIREAPSGQEPEYKLAIVIAAATT